MKWVTPVGGNFGNCGVPAAIGQEAVSSSFGDRLYSVSGDSGEVLWLQHEDGVSIFGPVVTDGNIYYSSSKADPIGNERDRYIHSLRASTGELNWQHRVRGQLSSDSGVVPFGDAVYVTVNDPVIDGHSEYGSSYSLDVSTGEVNCKFQQDRWLTAAPVWLERMSTLGHTKRVVGPITCIPWIGEPAS